MSCRPSSQKPGAKVRNHVKRKKIEKKKLYLFRERICGFSSVEFGSCYTWGTDESDTTTLPRKEEITVTQVALSCLQFFRAVDTIRSLSI